MAENVTRSTQKKPPYAGGFPTVPACADSYCAAGSGDGIQVSGREENFERGRHTGTVGLYQARNVRLSKT